MKRWPRKTLGNRFPDLMAVMKVLQKIVEAEKANKPKQVNNLMKEFEAKVRKLPKTDQLLLLEEFTLEMQARGMEKELAEAYLRYELRRVKKH